MIVTRLPWHQIADDSLIIGPSGKVWRLVGKFTDNAGRPYVSLVDAENIDGQHTAPHVDVNAEIEVIVTDSTLERAVSILSGSFALQRM
jgi:hypothetical protein